MDFKLDHDGIAAILKSPEMADVIAAIAEQVAEEVRASHGDAEVVVDKYVTDRVAASVTVKDPRAAQWQAQEGLLTRAAAAAGLEVTTR